MRDTAVAGTLSTYAEAISTIYARSRALLAAVVLAAVFAIGLLSGLAVSPTLRSASQPAAVSAGAISQAAAQAHLAWLRSEHDSYGSSTTSPASSLQSWIEYRQFRLSEEGYGQ